MILLIAMVVHAAANVLLAREDRDRPFGYRTFLHRWSLRILPLPLIVATVMTLQLPSIYPGASVPFWLTCVVPLWLPLLICPTLTFFRLRTLARRLGRPRLAEHINIVATGMGASLFVFAICTLFVVGEARHEDTFFIVFAVLPFALVGLFDLWALQLLFVVAHRFLRSAREAQMRWRAADAALVQITG